MAPVGTQAIAWTVQVADVGFGDGDGASSPAACRWVGLP